MKVIVETPNGRNIRIALPTGVILNRFSALIASKTAQKNGQTLTYEQAYSFMSALKDFKRQHHNWKLVEVESASGNHIEITI